MEMRVCLCAHAKAAAAALVIRSPEKMHHWVVFGILYSVQHYNLKLGGIHRSNACREQTGLHNTAQIRVLHCLGRGKAGGGRKEEGIGEGEKGERNPS